MPVASTHPANDESRAGTFSYMEPSTRPSLYRNSAVLTRRDADGNDAGTEGVSLRQSKMTVLNARLLQGPDRRTLHANGFELLTRPLVDSSLDFFEHDQVAREYYPECARIVQEATGAAGVFAFDHNIRSASGEKSARRIAGGQQVQGPAHLVHGDYTLTSAPDRIRHLGRPPSGNDTLRSVLEDGRMLLDVETVERVLGDEGRFAIINVWRNIAHEPVAIHPLALCDAQSVHPEDLVVFEIHYQDRVGENYFAKHSPRHRWYYYPELTRDEALLIKQWDSAGAMARSEGSRPDADGDDAPCTFSFHSAFEDPLTPPDAPDRWSIEVRCVVAYA